MLDKIYSLTTPWATANGVQIYKNRCLGVIANYIYPRYTEKKVIDSEQNNYLDNIIVSLTSYPARMGGIVYCINSLLRQSVRARKVILWLAETQYPNGKKDLPNNLLELCDYGLEIRFCDDLKSYKKIFYSAQEYSNSIIVTADDDTLYPENWLSNLLKTHIEYPDCIVCYRAHEITFDQNGLRTYKSWNALSKNFQGPSLKLVPIGVGGILYPPNFFDDVEFDFDVIRKYAPTTDDIWLKVLAVKKGIPAVKVKLNSTEWFTIKGSQSSSLKYINVENGDKNDEALSLLMSYYNICAENFYDL